MSGKPYTLREMKTVTEYLTERKAFGEIRGRKMWKELAESKLTNRTWQSLKETFLKRVLPDIHNPYYKLSVQEIASFKQGHDVQARLDNKLQIHSTDQDSNKKSEDKEKPDKDNNKKETNAAGEIPKESDLRASTETLILEDYANPEEECTKKSLRELITYTDPLTPMLQAVLDDFAGDEGEESNKKPGVQIEEVAKNNDNGEKVSNAQDKIKKDPPSPQKPQLALPKQDTDNENEKSSEISIILSDDDEVIPNNKIVENVAEIKKTPTSQQQTTVDTQTTTCNSIPDTQEASKVNINNKQVYEDRHIRTQKRAFSQPSSMISKKGVSISPNNDNKQHSISDTDTSAKNKEIKSTTSTLLTEKQIISKVDEPVLGANVKDNQVMEVEIQKEHTVDGTTQESNENKSKEIENPCLKSVSLYNEQFSNFKDTDSDVSNVEYKTKNEKHDKDELTKIKTAAVPKTLEGDNVPRQISTQANSSAKKILVADAENTTNANVNSEVVMLKSNSESINNSDNEKPREVVEQSSKKSRDKAMANMFGFSSGQVTERRKSSSKYKKRTSYRSRTRNHSSESCEWTSDTGSEYVSPPRGRKSRQTRKYLKPKSARILSLDEEGGLFVMHGNKIYPIVKDGKIVKNYVSLNTERDGDCNQEESFWKLKYVEEKRKTAELTKLLHSTKNDQEETRRNPVLPTTSRNHSPVHYATKSEANKVVSDNKLTTKSAGEPVGEQVQEDKTIKIKFTKNNEEVQLEGHWSHVNPVLAHVMQLFQKEPELTPKETRKTKVVPPALSPQPSSTKSAPVLFDEEVEDKIDLIESEIFKEIEEREKEKTPAIVEEIPKAESNITKRRGRPRKSQTSATESSPAKKPKVEEIEARPGEVSASTAAPSSPVATRSTTRTPQKFNKAITEQETVRTRHTSRKSVLGTNKESKEQEGAGSKVPSPPANRKSYSNKSYKVTKNSTKRKSSSSMNYKIYCSPESLSHNSIESSQGYQDSDDSPIKTYLKRKKRTSFTLPSYRTRRQKRLQKKYPYLTDDLTSDSSNSCQGAPLSTMIFQNSTVNSDVYKSESYQLLMNKNVTSRSKSSSQLERIDEDNDNFASNELQYISDQICKHAYEFENEEKERLPQTNSDSSSNVTLPTSPVLSIVENISINKSLLNNSNEFSFEDKRVKSEPNEHVMVNELMKSEGDVSMPLMEQDCGVETSTQNGTEYHYNLNVLRTSAVSESFLNKINIVNIKDQTLSESIHNKLKDLILESAKKNGKGETNSFKENVEMKGKEETKIVKSKKRSSTPRKRQSMRKLKLHNDEPCIEEEHMETCSHTGRNSCPPVMEISEDFAAANNIDNSIQISENPKRRTKKDVIKVKILKPKQKKISKETADKIIRDKQSSFHTDSGINDVESGVFLNTLNESVDLIHNHSETCLNANECFGDSVEIIKNASKSIISLDSDSNNCETVTPRILGNIPDKMAQELFSSNAQDVSILQRVNSAPEYKTTESASATVYHTPLGSLSPPDSLLTEDLSGEVLEKPTRNARWYLFSEDEFSNTNHLDINQNSIASKSFGANLNEIFPITCAIPDLSTITEISKENDENTRRSSDDTNTRNDNNSQNLFN